MSNLSPEQHTVICVDGYDPDNIAAVLAAAKTGLAAVIINGRRAHPDPQAPLSEWDADYSDSEMVSVARRTSGILERSGRPTPVFTGRIAARSYIPHALYWPDSVFDIYGDNKNKQPIAGGLDDAQDLLKSWDGGINIIAGGPMTEIAAITASPDIYPKLNVLAAQLGNYGIWQTRSRPSVLGKRIQYNYACDPDAADQVLQDWPGPLFMVPTDITKSDDVAIPNLETFERLKLHEELTELYRRAYPQLHLPQGGEIFIHDLHPTILMNSVLQGGWEPDHREPTDNLLFIVGNYIVKRILKGSIVPNQDPDSRGQLDREDDGSASGYLNSNHFLVCGTTVRDDIEAVIAGTDPDMTPRFSTFFQSVRDLLR